MVLKLASKELVIRYLLSKCNAVLGKIQCLRHGALGQRHACDAVGNPRDVENFKYLIDSPIGGTQQICFTISQFDFPSGNRAGTNLIFQATDEMK